MIRIPRPPTPPAGIPAASALYLLIASAAVAIAPHLLRLPLWLGSLTVVFLLWRVSLLYRRAARPGVLVRTAISVAVVTLVIVQYQTIFGRTAGSALLVVFAALKVLETRDLRDAMFANVLLTVVVLANFLFDQTPGSAAYGLLCLVLVVANFNALSTPDGVPAFGAVRLTSRILLHGLPLAIVVYVLFPRIEGSLWGIAEDPHGAVSGLSSTVSPGSVSRLSRNDEVAFRVDFSGREPDPESLYWRVLVLEGFDGVTWSRGSAFITFRSDDSDASGADYRYEVTLEANDERWLPTLDAPVSVGGRAFVSEQATAHATRKVRERIKYEARSVEPGYRRYPEPVFARAQPHRNIDPRVLALAEEVGGAGAEVAADALLRRFREQAFYYTLTPPVLGERPVAEFLFETRRGYCEHYASAFTAVMRAAGYPARVVVGYLGGERNPSGDYYIVRHSDAHAWSEVWVEGKGWLRVDPTAAVAPERIELGMDALRRLESAGELGSRISGTELMRILELDWLDRLDRTVALWTDAFTFQWNRWVLAYGPEQQRLLLRRLGVSTPDWTFMALGLATSLVVFMLATYLLLSRPGAEPESPVKYYRRHKRRLARAGLEPGRGEGPHDLARRAAAAFPDQAEEIEAIANHYAALAYGPPGRSSLTTLKELTSEFRIPGSTGRVVKRSG